MNKDLKQLFRVVFAALHVLKVNPKTLAKALDKEKDREYAEKVMGELNRLD